MDHNFLAGALVCAAAGAFADVRMRRIPNPLTYGALALGLAAQTLAGGGRGLATGLAGVLLGGGVLFLFFLMGGMGAGDVKLMAAVGAWVGPKAALLALVYTGLAGAALAVGAVVMHRRLRGTLANVGKLLRFHARAGLRPHEAINVRGPVALRVPYGVAIAAGTLAIFLSR